MDRYINPPSFLREQKARQVEKAQKKKHVPEEPRRDVLQFLLEHAPLENWERDVLAIVREEAFPGEARIVTSDIRDRDEIYDAIKRFLGKGL